MEASELVSIIVSIVVGIIVIILGIIAIFMSLEAVKTARQNRRKAENVYEQTKDLLHKIDQKSSITEQKVPENFGKPLGKSLDTQRELIDEDIFVPVP
jgi:hypothetical protein